MNGVGPNPYTSPSYGQSNGNSYGSHQPPPYSQPPSSNSFGMGSGMGPNPPYTPQNPMDILRGPRTQSPLNLSGITGVGNAVGISTLLPGNNQAPGSGGYNGGGPSSGMMLGGPSQHNPSNNGSIVVGGGVNNNLFPTPMPPAIPNSPQFTRTMPKRGLGHHQPSPQHHGMQPMPMSIPRIPGGVSDLSVISSMSSMPMNPLPMMPPVAPVTRRIQCMTDPPMMTNLAHTNPPMVVRNPSNSAKKISSNGADKQISPMKMTPNGDGQNAGNLSPKSQASDGEGDDQ